MLGELNFAKVQFRFVVGCRCFAGTQESAKHDKQLSLAFGDLEGKKVGVAHLATQKLQRNKKLACLLKRIGNLKKTIIIKLV